MILRFEVDEIGDMLRSGALCLLCILQTCASRSDSFVFLRQSISIKSFDFELFKQKALTVVSLPMPIIKWSQCRGDAIFIS